ncbi:MAG: phosphatidylserine decarboxylase family protein [Candidatus Zixiibacteriota bacterium]
MIAREGLLLIFVGLVITLTLLWGAVRWNSFWLFGASVVFALLTIFTTFFFRDPSRTIPAQPQVLVSPADGKIVGIDTLAYHPFIGGKALKISIFLSIFDVHINRAPTAGTIDFVHYNPGKFLAAYKDKASEVNEQTEIGMTSRSGHKLIFKQIAGIIARRIVCRLEENDTVAAGEKFGMIKYGSRTDLIVPSDSRLEIKLNDQVYAGSSVIGYLSEKPGTPDRRETVKENNAEI